MDQLTKMLLDDLHLEDLQPDAMELAEVVGMDAFKAIVCYCGGSNLYVPSLSTILIKSRNRKIIQEYNGFNQKQLARIYGMSQRHIKNIVNENKPD